MHGGDRRGVLTDAFFVPAFIRLLLAKTRDAATIASVEEGALEFRPEAVAREAIDGDGEIRWLSTEQSNTSVIVGGRIVMKLMRRLQTGVHLEAEMCAF